MIKSIIKTAFLSLVLGIIACTDETGQLTDSRTAPMSVQVSNHIISRTGLITTGTLPADEFGIGVTLVNKNDKNPYDGQSGYANNQWKTTNGTTWNIVGATNPNLTGTEGVAVAYYPYNPTVADYTAIPVESASQTDYMYSGWSNDLTNTSPQAEFTMQHALAAFKFSLLKGSYTGEGKITSISISSEALATKALLNATDGSLTSFEGVGQPVMKELTATLTTTTTDIFVLSIPTDVQSVVNISAVIDGKTYTATTASLKPLQGLMNHYTISLSSNTTEMIISQVSTMEWISKDYTLPELQPELPWVTATYYVNQSTIDIGMSPLTGYLMMLGLGELTDFVDRMIVDGVETAVAETGFETAGEHTVKFLFKDNAKVIPPMFFAFNLNLTGVDWNGSDWAVSQAAFCLCPELKKIPDWHTMASVGQGAFVYTGLEKLELPADWPTLSMLENNTFTTGFCSSPSMTSITVHPDNPLFFVPEGSNALMVRPELGVEGFLFGACANTVIPDNTTIIADYAFASVYSPKTTEELLVFLFSDDMSMISQPVELVLPESVQLVQPGAFSENIYLTSVTFGSNIFDLSDPFRPLLIGCPALNKIVSKAVSAPSFEHTGTVFETGTLYVPQGATGYEDWLNSLGSGWTLQNID